MTMVRLLLLRLVCLVSNNVIYRDTLLLILDSIKYHKQVQGYVRGGVDTPRNVLVDNGFEIINGLLLVGSKMIARGHKSWIDLDKMNRYYSDLVSKALAELNV